VAADAADCPCHRRNPVALGSDWRAPATRPRWPSPRRTSGRRRRNRNRNSWGQPSGNRRRNESFHFTGTTEFELIRTICRSL